MAIEPEEGRLDEEGHEGGPVKSFLEHLEDLRWTLIKCAVAIVIGVIVCLLGGNYVVNFLLRPLEKAKTSYACTNQVVTVSCGTNVLGTYVLSDALQPALNRATNRFHAVQVAVRAEVERRLQ